ncbi:MAG TPA: hypothetical protein VG410_12065 [Solirubrobacteraceae bacterium]|nr:hypothetical protein [Solirubrobacteraceae bacterium]
MSRHTAMRVAPTAVAAVLALIYVIAAPASLDLAAHLFRAKLFAAEGYGLWDNWWYAGHNVTAYSVLFEPVAAALTPQLTAALAAVASAATFEALAYGMLRRRAYLASLWFGAATATELFTGRLTFAFGLAPALGAVLALQRRRPKTATGLAFLTALASPVAALFAALAGIAYAAGTHRWRTGLGVVAAALVPVALLAIAFPEGGTFPFAFSALWPLLVIAAVAIPTTRRHPTLRAAIALYTIGCVAAFVLHTPIGANAARLGTLTAGPVAALLIVDRRVLLAVAAPLLYLQFEPPIRDLVDQSGDPSTAPAYYRPLLTFLNRQPGPPFRIEIPPTRFHYETYEVAPHYPLARGWERQLDIKYNDLFYAGPLTAATYDAWLHQQAVRFVAVADAPLDYAAKTETALIDRGLPYLRPVGRTGHWRIYAVRDATPIVTGAATLTSIGPNSLTLLATRPGDAFVRVHFTPYWTLGTGHGCVQPTGQFTELRLRDAGPAQLTIGFAFNRIGAHSPRCN